MGVKTSVVFFGSGPVAARSLELLSQNFTIEAVITKASTKTEMSALTKAPTFIANNKSELDALFEDKHFTSPVGVLIDFGIIVSQQVIDYFPKGIVNSHFSLLPEWRGADPITFAILSGQPQTGVSLMLLVEAMDEGPIISLGTEKLSGQETGPELTERLIQLSNSLLRDTLPYFASDTPSPHTGTLVTPQPQEEVCATLGQPYTPTYSRKLTKKDSVIDWQKSATQIEREVRAFLQWPKSKATLGTVDVVITSSKVVDKQIEPCGKTWVENKQLFVSCGKDSLQILTLKPLGKKDMTAESFLAGYGNRIES